MLVGKEEPLCTFCVWPWPSCVCVCVGDVPHTPALSTLCLERLLRSRGRANYSAFSHSQYILRIFSLPCGAIGFASQQHSLRLPSACNMHTHTLHTRHEPGPGSVCVITINNACNSSTVHTRAVRRRYLEVLPLLLYPRAVPRLLRMPYLLVSNVQQFWHFP